jgi:hypothetical protein
MYSLLSCGAGVGSGAANGFHELEAVDGSSLPNQPIRFPDSASVDGNQLFFAKTPTVISVTNRNVNEQARNFRRNFES